MNNKGMFDICPCVCVEYHKNGTSNFLRYVNGHAGMACMEVYEICDRRNDDMGGLKG